MMRVFFFCLLLIPLFFRCSSDDTSSPSGTDLVRLEGETMGTTYTIFFRDSARHDLQKKIDSLLFNFNNSVSTYVPNSTISIINKWDSTGLMQVDPTFGRVFQHARKMYKWSDGAFDPAIMPLVKYWGFAGMEAPDSVDPHIIDSLRLLVKFESFYLHKVLDAGQKDTVWQMEKTDPHTQLDFSASAKGYGVDIVAKFLDYRGIENYLVEIGGEVRARGNISGNSGWKVLIEDPTATLENRKVFAEYDLKNGAIATSGNYRNIRKVDGQLFAHTINPKTGYPEQKALLSASVRAPDCATADALATACMVKGVNGAKRMQKKLPGIDIFLIYNDGNGLLKSYASPDLDSIQVVYAE